MTNLYDAEKYSFSITQNEETRKNEVSVHYDYHSKLSLEDYDLVVFDKPKAGKYIDFESAFDHLQENARKSYFINIKQELKSAKIIYEKGFVDKEDYSELKKYAKEIEDVVNHYHVWNEYFRAISQNNSNPKIRELIHGSGSDVIFGYEFLLKSFFEAEKLSEEYLSIADEMLLILEDENLIALDSEFCTKNKLFFQEIKNKKFSEIDVSQLRETSSKTKHFSDEVLKPYREIEYFLRSNERLLVISGMAGTGKTECINKVLEKYSQIKKITNTKTALNVLNNKVAVCSKTTVGASNIRQKGFFNAKTLAFLFQRWDKSQHLDLFIVDEANMLTKKDIQTINIIFNTNNLTKFIFIGDDGQFRPFDFKKGAEDESFGLNINYLSKIFGKGSEVVLQNDFRLKKHFSKEYYEFLKKLREPGNKSPLETLDKLLRNTGDVQVVEESNKIVKFFNTKVHIGSLVRLKLKTDTADEVLYYLKKKEEFIEMNFEDDEALEAIELYRGQKNRRPALGELYAQYYPDIKKRLAKKNDLNTIVSLFRRNIDADIANLLIRPHIFDDEYNNDSKILKGEVLFIKQLQNSFTENYLIKTELDVGDSFIVTSTPRPVKFLSLDSSPLKDIIEDKVWLIDVKPVLKFSKGRLGNFLLNALPEAFQLDNRKMIVWTGDLSELRNSHEELLDENALFEKYQEVVSVISKLKIDPDYRYGVSSDDLSKIARVKYDYARVSFAAQGGEWDNVIIQLEDSWDQSRFLYTCFTRAVERTYIFN
ncbi:ATP-dependent helicase [Acidimicrobiia bacterium]|nr:ATP-dependent helicase [Acidimicrobiia bacterium]